MDTSIIKLFQRGYPEGSGPAGRALREEKYIVCK
jgi:hypothetical protein